MEHARGLAGCRRADEPRFGGKSANLGELRVAARDRLVHRVGKVRGVHRLADRMRHRADRREVPRGDRAGRRGPGGEP